MSLFQNRAFSHFDYVSLILVLPLVYFSHHLMVEANAILAQKQLIYFGISALVFVFVFFIPFRKLLVLIPIFYWIGIILLLGVEFFGVTKLGAKRWLELPLIGMTIQPSELFKPVFILMMGWLIFRNPVPTNGYDLKKFSYLSFFILLPFILIAKEPDLGTALVLLLVGYGILFIVGVNWKIWASIVLIIGLSSPITYTYLIKDYQKKRINDFISKDPSYHVQQSIIAIGAGGVLGQSEEDATQTKLKFLPIATSDFIFAFLVERYGFLGAFVVVLLYLLLILHLLSFNFFYKSDPVLKTVASGIGLLIFLDMAVNILMVIGFAPVVGLPLPMFSYGGSSFINFVTLFAILQNLVTFRFKDSYEFERKI